MHRIHAKSTLSEIGRFLSDRGLKLYTGYGVAWDETGRVLNGGSPTWWAKLLPDGADDSHYTTATGRTLVEAVERVVEKRTLKTN